MSGQIFDVVNLLIALSALALGVATAYWQHRKVDGLSISIISFDLSGGNGKTVIQFTFSLANTGSMPAIVSAIYYMFPIEHGERIALGHAADLQSRTEPILIGAGELAHGTVFFEVADGDLPRSKGEEREPNLSFADEFPGSIQLDMVSGKGHVVSRQLGGFAVAKHEHGSGWSCARPRYKTAVLLPKPGSDTASPLGF